MWAYRKGRAARPKSSVRVVLQGGRAGSALCHSGPPWLWAVLRLGFRGWYELSGGLWQGNADAQYNIGLYNEHGIGGIGPDSNVAVRMYGKAAKSGSLLAQNSLGACYEQGHGVSRDCKKAAKWYLRAALGGLAAAQANLGLLYQKGKSPPPPPLSALACVRHCVPFTRPCRA